MKSTKTVRITRSHYYAARRTLNLLAGYLGEMPSVLHAYNGGVMSTGDLYNHATQCAKLLKPIPRAAKSKATP